MFEKKMSRKEALKLINLIQENMASLYFSLGKERNERYNSLQKIVESIEKIEDRLNDLQKKQNDDNQERVSVGMILHSNVCELRGDVEAIKVHLHAEASLKQAEKTANDCPICHSKPQVEYDKEAKEYTISCNYCMRPTVHAPTLEIVLVSWNEKAKGYVMGKHVTLGKQKTKSSK